MLPSNVYKKVKVGGFTSLEIAVTLIVAGILAAISAPSIFGLYNNYQLDRSLEEVRTAFQEAKFIARQKGESCTVSVDTTNNKITATNPSCLISGDRTLPSELKIEVANFKNSPSNDLTFSFKGTSDTEGMIVLYKSNGLGEKKCMAISAVTGVIRTGIYDDAAKSITSIDETKCKPEKQV